MPTVLRLLGWRFHFYSDEGGEPPHIHVDAGDGACKFWLTPVRLGRTERIKPIDLRKLETVVAEHEQFFLEKWYEYFGH
jgi:hypothetical protein